MSGGSKHEPIEVAAEALRKSMNFEPTCETPALRKSGRVWGFWLGVEKFTTQLIGQCFYLLKWKTKLICRAKGFEQKKSISPCIQGPMYNQQ